MSDFSQEMSMSYAYSNEKDKMLSKKRSIRSSQHVAPDVWNDNVDMETMSPTKKRYSRKILRPDLKTMESASDIYNPEQISYAKQRRHPPVKKQISF